MPCRYARGDRSDRGIGDDDFRRTALAIGDRRSLAALIDREGSPDLYPEEPVPGARDGRQYAWTIGAPGTGADAGECPADHGSDGPDDPAHGDRGTDADPAGAPGGCPVDHGGSDGDPGGHRGEADATDDHGAGTDGGDRRGGEDTAPSPRYHLLAFLEYAGGVPDVTDREAVGTALGGLERAFGWGPGGIVASLGYSRRYFERFEAPLPDRVAAAVGAHDPAVAADGGPGGATADALLHLASDDPRTLLAAERSLWGGDPPLDVSLDATFEGVFERPCDPPRRRVAEAVDDAALPDPDAGIGPGSPLDGAAVERVSVPDGGGSDARGSADGCPVHGGGQGDDPGGSDGAPGRAVPGVTLVGLSPADPAEVRVSFGDLDGGDGGDAFLVPSVADRSLPDPVDWGG